MVVVVNLEEETKEGEPNIRNSLQQSSLTQLNNPTDWNTRSGTILISSDEPQPSANESLFSAALACYPVISQIARNLDLNTLDNLSRTCRLFRALLRPCQKSLIAVALRCSYSEKGVGREDGDNGSGTSYGKVKKVPCATDLVGDCRRCGTLVCRNCTAKALPPSKLAKRHRRLCDTCAKAPLSKLMASHLTGDDPAFTASAFGKGPCDCPLFFWLCQPCGQFLPVHDIDYQRIWQWRIRYSTYLGGLGTGIGEGYEGVKCGRGQDCLAARKIEVEEDCSSDSNAGTPQEGSSRPTSQSSAADNELVGYFRQEVEGIGGSLKAKFKKMVVIGQPVREFEDERENGNYLSREADGLRRSWCWWCGRIVPSVKDKELLAQNAVIAETARRLGRNHL